MYGFFQIEKEIFFKNIIFQSVFTSQTKNIISNLFLINKNHIFTTAKYPIIPYEETLLLTITFYFNNFHFKL
jgi:hypothetical protein